MKPKQYFPINAFYVAEKLDVAKLEEGLKDEYKLRKQADKVVLTTKSQKRIFLYSFGSIIFIDYSKPDIDAFFQRLAKLKVMQFRQPIEEIYGVRVDPRIRRAVVEFSRVIVPRYSAPQIDIICRVLAQSIALEHIETVVDKKLEKVGEINQRLVKEGKLSMPSTEIMKTTGELSQITQVALTKIDLLDKPALTWEYKSLNYLYEDLRAMFELDPRFRNLKFKMDYITNQFAVLMESIRSKTEERLELIIIILIAVEILLWISEWFLFGVN